jgi:molybdopterin molybdotransferase
LATGSEILEVGQTQTLDAQIRSSNNYTLEALVSKYGGNPIQFGSISDDKEAIKEKFNEALASADIVVSTGGVSVGDYDFVKDIVQSELGFEVIFKGVKIKPGQHVMLAQRNNQFIVALPGFAFSSTVTALLYLVPLIARMQGLKEAPRLFRARLREDFKKRSNKSEFTPCRVCLEAGEYVVDFEDKKVGTSAIMTNMLGDTALIVSAPSDGDKIAGEYVQIMML